MNTIYQRFKNSSLDLSALGLHDGSAVSSSAAGNSKVLCWLIDSPVYFCLVSEQEYTVYAVDPTALPEERVLPVAKDVLEFIGLLVRCKDASLIAKAYQWSSFRFRELLDGTNPGMKARSVIRALENTYQPPVIDDPVALLMQLQKEFRDNREAREADWRVGYGTDFFRTCPKGKAGKELALNKALAHKHGTWHVPAIYLCENGIVADTLLEVQAEYLETFQRSWCDRSDESLSLADKLQRQLEDPLNAAVNGILSVNEKPLECKKSFTAVWNPLRDNDTQVRRILNHYKLNPDCGYLFKRYCFPRKGKYNQFRSMQLTLEAVPVMVPDQRFTVQKAGERFRFTHPGTGLEHIFTVTSVSNEALNPNFLTNHPCCYTRLNYALEPSISPDNFRVVDQNPGDQWEGYQDEPAAVIYADRRPDPGRYALSALHYEPQDQVHWQMIFRRKLHPDLQLQLLP